MREFHRELLLERIQSVRFFSHRNKSTVENAFNSQTHKVLFPVAISKCLSPGTPTLAQMTDVQSISEEQGRMLVMGSVT